MMSEKNLSALRIDGARLESAIRKMGMIGYDPETNGRTRFALSDEDRQARDLFCGWLRDAGLEVKIDAIGNIFGVRAGTDPNAAPIMMGSHLDTVRHAGMFDGIVGVLGGLEVVRTLNDAGVQTKSPLIVADFTNEEGAYFEYDMMGSSVFTGHKKIEDAYAVSAANGETAGESLKRIGYAGSEKVRVGKYFEFHIEQGPVLDAEKIEIGVVEGIQGVAWWRCAYDGEANHAGSTPMHMRRDTFSGVAELSCALEKLANEEIANASVVTIGRVNPEPNIINIVPGRCSFTVDFRQFDPALFAKAKEEVVRLIAVCAEKRGLTYEAEQIVNASPVIFNKEMVSLVETSAKELGFSTKRLYSGAGHDAQFLSLICPTAMIFVPSLKGRSHCPEEWTAFGDIENGCNVLLHAVLRAAVV